MLDTPSPEMKRSNLLETSNGKFHSQPIHTTPKGAVCRKIANSPAFLAKGPMIDFTELSMSPLQLMDSPVHQAGAAMTPGTSSGESPTTKQTSTPQAGVSTNSSSSKNEAFHVANTVVKAKRRLIQEESPAVATKKLKPSVSIKKSSSKRSFGQINSGVSHRIRRPEKRPRLSVSLNTLSLSDLKKAKDQSSPKNPLDPLTKADVEVSTIEKQSTVEEVILPAVAQPQSPAVMRKIMSKKEPSTPPVIPHKTYTPNWNQRYKNKDIGKEKKFFKTRADRVVTVSVNDNLKLQILDKNQVHSKAKVAENVDEVVPSAADLIPSTKNSQKMEDEITAVDVMQQEWEEDPVECMNISSNIQDILDGLSEEETVVEIHPEPVNAEADNFKENQAGTSNTGSNTSTKKLFPLFYKDTSKPPVQPEPSPVSTKKTSLKSQWIRARNDGQNQMMLDAGQKAFGAVQCPECMLVYHVKEPEDELLHTKIHDSLKDNLKFMGWKKERLVRKFDSEGAEVLAVHPGDAAHCWKKVHTVLKNVVDHELGFSEIGIRNPESTKVYLYVTEKKIVGVLVVEAVSRGYRMVLNNSDVNSPSSSSNKCCSSVPTPAVVGVSRIWTLASYRRRKVASRLLDAMRSDFVYGKVVSTDEIAFSDPTDNGLNLAEKYAQRTDFLVYNM